MSWGGALCFTIVRLSVHLSIALKKVCIINSSYSFKATDPKLCTNVLSILKICTFLPEEKKEHFDKIKAYLAALLFWLFGGFRCGVPLFIVVLVIY